MAVLVTGPAKIVWGMTLWGPLPYQPVYTSHLEAVAYAQRELIRSGRGEVVGLGATDRMYTHSAENQLVKDFLAIEGATHLFLTESDMVLPKDVLVKLLDLDRPIAAGLYVLRGGRGQPCLFQQVITPAHNKYPMSPVTAFPLDRPFRTHCPGVGCVLLRREVFERLPFPWFDLKEAGYGSDLYFYTHVREAGIEVWVDPSVRCGHMDYTQATVADYVARAEGDPAWLASGVILA